VASEQPLLMQNNYTSVVEKSVNKSYHWTLSLQNFMYFMNSFIKWEIPRKLFIYTAISPKEFLYDQDLKFLVL